MRVIIAVIIGCAMLTGCQATPEQIAAWKMQLVAVQDEMSLVRAELVELDPDTPMAKRLIKLIDRLEPFAATLQDNIATAETGGDLLWGLATAAAGFFPPLAVLLPVLRSMRRTQTRVFEAVAAGGGPKNTTAARAHLVADPKAYLAYKAWEAQHGG